MSNKPILVIYASRFGHSHKIAQSIEKALEQSEQTATLTSIGDITSTIEFNEYSGIVLIGSVQYGHIDKRATKWVIANLQALESMPTLLITVSLTARKYVDSPCQDISEHVYTQKFLDKTGWHPQMIELAAGILEYPRYNFFDRKMIQLIMNISGGVTDGTSTIEYTNWDRITEVGNNFAKLVDKSHPISNSSSSQN